MLKGIDNTITGKYSNVKGKGNISNIENQTVVGQYNSGKFILLVDDTFVVGTGTSDSDKADGFKVRTDT
jgi:hypothetical protein